MGGKAIVDVILGRATPSGKLPVSFPKHVGQVPIYYNARNSGRPAAENNFIPMDEIPVKAPQTSIGNYSFHMDAGYEPLYPFGFGLSYTRFAFGEVFLEKSHFAMHETIPIYIDITNVGVHAGAEVVQLYTRDRFASITRPVRELKRFKKVYLKPGEWQRLAFELTAEDLAFFGKDNNWKTEPGDFDVWIGSDSRATHHAQFTLTP
jgi:beta-glucosidase